jgi:hypothetical protein
VTVPPGKLVWDWLNVSAAPVAEACTIAWTVFDAGTLTGLPKRTAVPLAVFGMTVPAGGPASALIGAARARRTMQRKTSREASSTLKSPRALMAVLKSVPIYEGSRNHYPEFCLLFDARSVNTVTNAHRKAAAIANFCVHAPLRIFARRLAASLRT